MSSLKLCNFYKADIEYLSVNISENTDSSSWKTAEKDMREKITALPKVC